ncbi:DUF4097 family beta strand repeat-containing protein [Nocardia terpenica]|uniref:DUF4097 domain-containing protein n=1 Tax=Nocardia terpenica TaxID=455432 RepID=A0A291RI54_9NOCA|nr:DUF4097 family beta strand repeat-containing protein [Nocardia terpenica]ATL67281.1 hypothetical protein CRH09_14840 [Nocardia terpenica]
MPRFDTPKPIAVTVDACSAEVRLVASERSDTVVRIDPVDTDNGSDVKVADKTKVDFYADRLTVTVPPASGWKKVGERSSVAVTIELPTDSSLIVKLMQARLYAEGSLGACEVRLESGIVRLDRIGALRAQITNGDIAIEHIAGSAEADGVSGPIRIGTAAGDLRLSTVNGGLDLDRADGKVIAKTVDGALRIGRLNGGAAELMNVTGNIEIGIGEGTAAWIDAYSRTGSVRSHLAAQEDPGEFDTTVQVLARTRDGDIAIRRATA